MNFRQRRHLSQGKSNNLTNKTKNILIKNSKKIVEDFFNKNKISNIKDIRLREIISKINKKKLPKNNIQKAFQKQNLFHNNQHEQRIRYKSENKSKTNNFVKNNSSINLKPKNLIKNAEMKFANLLKEKKTMSNDNIKSKIRPLSSYDANMKKAKHKSIKLKYLFNNNIQINFNIFILKKNSSNIFCGKKVIDWIKENKKVENKKIFDINKKMRFSSSEAPLSRRQIEKNIKNKKEKLKKKRKENKDRIKKEKEEENRKKEEEKINSKKEKRIKKEREEQDKTKKEELKKKQKEEEDKIKKEEEIGKKEEEEKRKKEEEDRIKKEEEEKRKKEEEEKRKKEEEEEKRKKEEEEKRKKEEEEKRKKEEEEKRKKEEEEKRKKEEEEEKRKKEEEEEKRKKEEEEKRKKEEEEKRKKEEEEEKRKKEEEEEKRKKEGEEKRKKEEEDRIKKEEEEEKKKKEEEEKRKKEEEFRMKYEKEEKEKEKKDINKGENNQKENLVEESQEFKDKSSKRVNMKYDKELCDKIVSSLPKREKTNLNEFKNTIKSKAKDLTEIERAFVLFKWMGQNINYDVKNTNAGKRVDCSKDGVFRTGKTVCSGYSNLYEDIAKYLNLEVKSVHCYAKGAGYMPGTKIHASETNHEINVIKLNGKWYHIDSTWGAGHSNGNEYVREFNEFYFLPDPELLIRSHFPSDEKWQLTKKIYTLIEFEKWPCIHSNFYQCGFRDFSPEEGYFELKDSNTKKFIIYGENIKGKGLMCSHYLLNGKMQKEEHLSLINFYNDKIEIDCIFNKKGKYKVDFLGNKGDSLIYTSALSYVVNVFKDAKILLSYPEAFSGSESINIIEPLYDKLKSGEKVKFKMKSDLKEIFISNGDIEEYLDKNKDGFFEKEITIKAKPGEMIEIGQSQGCIINYYYRYNVVK